MSTVQTAAKDKGREVTEPKKGGGGASDPKPEPTAPVAAAPGPKPEFSPPSTSSAVHPVHEPTIESLAALSDEALSIRFAEAQAEVTEIQREIEQRRAKKATEFLASIRDQARALGIDPVALAAALGGGKKGGARTRSSGDARSAVAKKYRNPENASQTWAGRGATPKWIELDPATKKPLAKFLIPASS